MSHNWRSGTSSFGGPLLDGALELKALLTGKRVLAPRTLIEKYPEMRNIADPAADSGEAESGEQMSLLA